MFELIYGFFYGFKNIVLSCGKIVLLCGKRTYREVNEQIEK